MSEPASRQSKSPASRQSKRDDIDTIFKGGSGVLERIILSGYSSMPKGVRVVVFLVSFILFVYIELLLTQVATY